jgi:hypothetical protein
MKLRRVAGWLSKMGISPFKVKVAVRAIHAYLAFFFFYSLAPNTREKVFKIEIISIIV